MGKLLVILFCCCTLSAFAQPFEFNYQNDFSIILNATNDTGSELFYPKLLQRFRASDTTLSDYDILALLIGFTDDQHYRPYTYLATEKQLYQLNEEGNFNRAVAVSDSFLLFVPVSQQAIIEKSFAFYQLGMQDSSDRYMWQFRKIMMAMAQSGNGFSPETAIFSLGPVDGQNFIQKFLLAEVGTMTAVKDSFGNVVDMMEAKLPADANNDPMQIDLYFQIQPAVNSLLMKSP